MGYWEVGFNGSSGGSFRLRMHADVVAQEEDNNRSLVRYSAYVDRVTSGSRIWNFNTTCGNTNINGYNPQRCIGGYDTTGAGRVFTMALNEDYWIGHDANGNANPQFGCNYNPDNSPYWTASSMLVNMGLPSLYLWAAPTYVEFNNVTDTKFNFRVVTNRVVDNIAVSINGGGWIYHTGATQDKTMTFGDSGAGALKSNATYSVRISLRRQSSGYWQEHGNWNVTTAEQGRFFDFNEF